MSYFYIASPYTHPQPDVREHRFQRVKDYAAMLLGRKVPVFSPILYTHHMGIEYSFPVEWDFWWIFNEAMLRNAEGLHVLKLPGWEQSRGIEVEVDYAIKNNKEIIYVEW